MRNSIFSQGETAECGLFGSKTHYWGILFPIATGNWSAWTGKEGDEQLTLC